MVGITGNIGTGKSTVAQMLANLGAEVIDADQVAHEVMQPGTPVHAEVVATFGSHILTADGEIDRKKLGRIVFGDPDALGRLEAIVHPATLEVIWKQIVATRSESVAVEAIKLLESGLAEICDAVWVTTCRREQQIERLVRERDLSRDEARRRIDAQGPAEDKIAQADVVINNAGPLSATRRQVDLAWAELTARAGVGG